MPLTPCGPPTASVDRLPGGANSRWLSSSEGAPESNTKAPRRPFTSASTTSLAVDTAHGVISHIQADLADSRDSVHLPQLVTHLHQRLLAQGVPLQDLVADTNYSNGVNYALLEQQGSTPWIPVLGKYKPAVEGFTYDLEQDRFTYPAGKPLPFRSFDTSLDGGLSKTYRASTRDCRLCPRKATCAPKTNKRKVTRTAYDPHYRRALLRQQSQQGQRMRLLRQSTVEPVFGSLLQHYGLRQVNTRSRASAHKTMLLAAMAYNLKKLLKHRPPQAVSQVLALPLGGKLAQCGQMGESNKSHDTRPQAS